MFGSIGTMELVVILVIAMIVFGPRKLPELGKSLGKSLGEFKRASNDLRNTLEDEIHVEEQARRDPEPAKPESAQKPVAPPDPAPTVAQGHVSGDPLDAPLGQAPDDPLDEPLDHAPADPLASAPTSPPDTTNGEPPSGGTGNPEQKQTETA